MHRYGSQHRGATRAGCQRSPRYMDTQRRMALVIGAVARIGRADQLLPQTSDTGLARTLEMLAATVDPATHEGAAIIVTVTKTPKAVAAWVRRNRERVQQILDAQRTNGPPP